MKYILPLLIITTFVYLPIYQVFFQHEEWAAFGNFLSGQNLHPLSPAVAHYVPLTLIMVRTYFNLFSLDSTKYATVSLVSHLMVSILVYKLTRYLFTHKILALISSLFFALNASSHQATTWLVADVNTHMSTLFTLISMTLVFNRKTRWLTPLILIISLLFKETSIGIFVFIPIMLYLYRQVQSKDDQHYITKIGLCLCV